MANEQHVFSFFLLHAGILFFNLSHFKFTPANVYATLKQSGKEGETVFSSSVYFKTIELRAVDFISHSNTRVNRAPGTQY